MIYFMCVIFLFLPVSSFTVTEMTNVKTSTMYAWELVLLNMHHVKNIELKNSDPGSPIKTSWW